MALFILILVATHLLLRLFKRLLWKGQHSHETSWKLIWRAHIIMSSPAIIWALFLLFKKSDTEEWAYSSAFAFILLLIASFSSILFFWAVTFFNMNLKTHSKVLCIVLLLICVALAFTIIDYIF